MGTVFTPDVQNLATPGSETRAQSPMGRILRTLDNTLAIHKNSDADLNFLMTDSSL